MKPNITKKTRLQCFVLGNNIELGKFQPQSLPKSSVDDSNDLLMVEQPLHVIIRIARLDEHHITRADYEELALLRQAFCKNER